MRPTNTLRHGVDTHQTNSLTFQHFLENNFPMVTWLMARQYKWDNFAVFGEGPGSKCSTLTQFVQFLSRSLYLSTNFIFTILRARRARALHRYALHSFQIRAYVSSIHSLHTRTFPHRHRCRSWLAVVARPHIRFRIQCAVVRVPFNRIFINFV